MRPLQLRTTTRRLGGIALTLLPVALLPLALSAGSCEQQPVEGPCSDDSQCGDYRFCNEVSGLCQCADDRGCSNGEFCNPAFMCQIVAGCRDNGDCLGETFCDVLSGRCIGDDQCSIETHCPFNQVCDPALGSCVEGCSDEADCVLGYACIGATRSSFGQCAIGVCRGNELCGVQELCNMSTGTCVFDDRGDYCGACQNTWEPDECGGGANYCLVDTADPSGRSYYCGVDCSQGQECPFAYECHDVIILPPAAPLCRVEGCLEGACSQTGGPCVEDQDCAHGPPGGDCARARIGNCLQDQTLECGQDSDCCEGADCPPGSCVTQECRGGEGDALGHCTCTRDLDCPAQRCMDADLSDPDQQIPGTCELSGHACYTDLDCAFIACVEGGCQIGSNCAPADDRTCRDLDLN